MRLPLLLLAAAFALSGCEQLSSDRPETAQEFPEADRPVSRLGATEVFTETARDERGEAQKVMDLAEITSGMTVADIGRSSWGVKTIRSCPLTALIAFFSCICIMKSASPTRSCGGFGQLWRRAAR